MKSLARTVETYWFAGAPAMRLALLRVLVGGFALWYLLPRYEMFVEVGRTDPSLFEPVGIMALFPGPIPPDVFRLLTIANLVACVAFVLGWRHRLMAPVFAVLMIVVLCNRNSWSMIYHTDNILLFHIVILACAPSADAISLDARRRRRHEGPPPPGLQAIAPEQSWGYGWPIRLMCAVTVLVYFLCGVAKVAGPLGWGWASGEVLWSQVAVDGLRKELLGSGATPLTFTLYEYRSLLTIMAAGSLVLELGAPAAMANRRLGWLWCLATFAMHWGIFAVMGIRFRYQLSGVVFASFFPLERFAALVSPATRRILALAATPDGSVLPPEHSAV